MKKFILKVLLVFAITAFIIMIRLVSLNFNNFSKSYFKYMPINNVSNSPSFRAKMDHLVHSENYKHCTFLIAGSSMSLNNISGEVFQSRTNEMVYNISSWCLKPIVINQLIQMIDVHKIKYVLMAFNNTDFDAGSELRKGVGYEIDFKATDSYINGNVFRSYYSVVDKFDINTFSEDWDFRCKFSSVDNAYESIKFDKYGSVMLNHNGFILKKKWASIPVDTTRFYNSFFHDVKILDSICKYKNIKLILVYVPTRPNVLTEKNVMQNQKVSQMMKLRFGRSYIDMQKSEIPLIKFCDGFHMFKEGAESLTNSIVDSIVVNKIIFSSKNNCKFPK